MTLSFNDLRPLFPFIVQQVGTMVQIKPFPSYYIWLDWFDLAPLDFSPAIDILTELIADVNDIAVEALANAATAAAAASTAQATADQAILDAAAAQADADAALAAAGSSARRATMWHDESLLGSGTIVQTLSSGQKYGYFRHCVTQGHLFSNSFVCDLTPGATITFFGATNNGSGILHVYVDEVSIGTIDWYTAGLVPNVEKAISVPSATFGNGYHKLWMLGITKNASSSGYPILLTKISVLSNNGA